MAYSTPEIRNFVGLHLQANSFEVPDGAMEQAENVVISKDGIVTKRRGTYEYYDPSSDTLNNLMVFQSVLMAIFTDKVGYFTDAGSSPNYTGTRSTLSGATVKISGSRVSRTAQSNKNLYFTTDNGVLKLESYSGSVYKAGAPQALDLRCRFLPVNGPVESGIQLGWRAVFGRRDGNDNLILGAPSEVFTLTNATLTSIAWSRTTNVVTVVSTAHGLATGMSITVSASTSGANPVVAGSYTVTVTTLDAFTIVSSDTDDTGTLTYAVTRSTRIELTVPSEITSTAEGYFYRIYRSSQVVSTADGIFSDFKLIDEQPLTSGQISSHIVFYTDDIDDILLGEELYTNENSGEGEAQANYRPPKCEDMAFFKGSMLYGNVTQRHLMNLNVVDAAAMATTDYIEILATLDTAATYTSTGAGPYTVTVTSQAHGLSSGHIIFVKSATDSDANGSQTVTSVTANTFTFATSSNPSSGTLEFGLVRRYVGRTGIGNKTTTAVLSSSAGILFTQTAHGFLEADTIYVSNVTGTLATGTYYVKLVSSDTYRIALTSGGTAIAYTDETAADTQGVTNTTYPIFKLDITSSASIQLADTARGIVKAINRDSSSLVYAAYASGINDNPGRIRIQAKGFIGAIYFRGNDATTGGAFVPVLPAAFDSGTQAYSRNATLPNVVMAAKPDEPEAVPLVNQYPGGASNKDLLRILPLRDSVIILKNDGVFRMTGDGLTSYAITPLDTTVICVAPSSAKVINNQVIFLSNQGVCLVTESSVQIVSRKIEDVIQPILGLSTIATETSAVSYESERFYYLTTLLPNETTASVTYIYNILNDTWVTSDVLLAQGEVGPADTLFIISDGNKIMKERKNQTRIDWTGQNAAVTVVSVDSDLLGGQVSFPAGITPEAGDVILKDNIFSRIETAVLVSGTTFALEFRLATNLLALDAVNHYKRIESSMKMAPYHAGLTGRMKQYSQFQMHFRNDSITECFVTFSSDTFGSSQETDWESLLIALGWGQFPFGFEPWGQEDGIDVIRTTRPAPIFRTWVPDYAARSTFLQPIIIHRQAGEPINMQSQAWAVRAYNERVTR